MIHDSSGDACDATVSEAAYFDLRPYAEYVMGELDVPGGIVSTSFGSYAFGELSCDDLRSAAGLQVSEAAEQTLGLGCSKQADCVETSVNMSCVTGCGAMISTAGEQPFTTTKERIQATLCDVYDANECGPFPAPVCEERGPLDCVEGRCVELSP